MTTNDQENNSNSAQKGKRVQAGNTRPVRGPRRIDTYELRTWLSELNLGVLPTVHVNGSQHPTAVITVDFGSPIPSIRLTGEQMQELSSRLRRLTKELVREDANIRIHSDNQNGVHWSVVS